MEESPTTNIYHKNKLILLMSAGGIFLFLLIAVFLILNSSRSNNNISNTVSPTPGSQQTTPEGSKNFNSFPKAEFASWKMLPTNVFSATAEAKIYTLKQNFLQEDVIRMASVLGANGTLVKNNDYTLSYNTDDSARNASSFVINTKTGQFRYYSYDGMKMSTTGNPTNGLIELLQRLGIYDETIKLSATYKKNGLNEITYYEFHRDWQAAGMPILNVPGLLNIPEFQPFSSLTLNTPLTLLSSDPSIVFSSDGKVGKARQKDFNTITIAVLDNENKIMSIDSNIRPLQQSATTSLFTQKEIEDKIHKNQFDTMFINPAGSGNTNWDVVYPGNKAKAREAVITDFRYAYIETFPTATQDSLAPYAIIRGYAQLESGYRTNFVATVKAGKQTSQTQSWKFPFIKSVLASTGTQQSSGVNFTGSITDAPQQVLSIIPTIPPQCEMDNVEFDDRVIVIDGIVLRHAKYRFYKKDGQTFQEDNYGRGYWYYMPQTGFNETIFRQHLAIIGRKIDQFVTAIGGEGYKDYRVRFYDKDGTYYADGNWQGVWEEVNNQMEGRMRDFNWNDPCPVRLTGGSPTLFIYGKPGTELTVHIPNQLTFSDPPALANSWKVTLNEEGLTANNSQRNYIYYEYKPETLTRPAKGWNVAKTDLSNLSQKIAERLQLTSEEEHRLLFEIENAAQKISDSTIFVGIANQKEINQKVPLKIEPSPQSVHRLHFYVGKIGKSSSTPALLPIKRTESMVLEIGSYAEE